MDNIRKVIANYMKDKYINNKIGGPPDINKIVAIDETLIIHQNGFQKWLVGGIETRSRKLRLDIIPS